MSHLTDLQPQLPFATEDITERERLVQHWLTLTRETLPKRARQNRWPISRDHCFMRVCFDHAMGAPWHTLVKRPAIKHVTMDQLNAAIDIAQLIICEPHRLAGLNQQSIEWRRRL